MNQLLPFNRVLNRRLVVMLWVFTAFGWVGATKAGERDHERAMQAMEAGQIKPLTEILAIVTQEVPGRVIAVELEDERGQWIYEIKLIQDSGLVKKLDVDARSGQLLRSRGD